ncbi:vanadium-binding protein 2-like [Clavelina lepadiformis]|uniref:Vanadium-binding protein 4 n=1 Tax=Clavelina lepadiformis TaxID=159417 RepID=A0ABP0GWY1_CLALP
MKFKVLIFLALCVLLLIVDAKKRRNKMRARKNHKKSAVPSTAFCGNVCQTNCTGFKVCKKTCPKKCAAAVNPKLCKRNCFVNDCDKNTCRSCLVKCRTSDKLCRMEHCSVQCPMHLQKRFKKNPVCAACLVANCRGNTDTARDRLVTLEGNIDRHEESEKLV